VARQSKTLRNKELEGYQLVKAELKKLKKETARKDKALAEAAALFGVRNKGPSRLRGCRGRMLPADLRRWQ